MSPQNGGSTTIEERYKQVIYLPYVSRLRLQKKRPSDQRIPPGHVDVDLAFLTRPGRDPKSK
jgi:hypothetical protein